jgi:hypothetical protein
MPPCTTALLIAGLAAAAAGAPSMLRVAPGASLPAALAALRGAPPPRELLLAPGVHRLLAPLELTAADSGVTLRGEPGAAISGGVPLNFSRAEGGLWAAALPPALLAGSAELSTLYVNGQRRLRAREPNALGAPPWSFAALFGDAATFAMAGPLEPCSKPAFGSCPAANALGFFAATRGARAPNASWAAAGAVVGVAEAWTLEHARLAAYDGATGRVSLAAPLSTPVGAFGTAAGTPSGGRWFLEDFREALNAPGEYFVAGAQLLYVPLPAEAAAGPGAAAAEMPALTALWKVAGSAAAPAANVTLRDIEVRLWGDAPGERERFPGSYTAALHVGPFVAGLALRNLTLRAGASNAVCFSGGNVSGTVMDRLTVTDIGGRAVEGCAAALSFAVAGTVLANSTISHVGFNYMSGGAAAVIGTGAAFVHNEVFDVPLNGVVFQQAGGPSREAAPSAEIAFNHLHDLGGEQVLSDFGACYINANSDARPATNWLAADVHHNLIERSASYNYGSNGVYSDHGTSGAYVHHNVITGLGGRGLSPHAGLNLTAVNNLIYNVSLQPFAGAAGASCVVSGPQGGAPGFSLALRANIFAQPTGGSAIFYSTRDAFWAPPRAAVASNDNVFWAGAAGVGVFPDGKGGATGLAGWRALSSQDAGSAEADPLLAAPQVGDFRVLPASPAWARGWQEIDLSSVGPLPEGGGQ